MTKCEYFDNDCYLRHASYHPITFLVFPASIHNSCCSKVFKVGSTEKERLILFSSFYYLNDCVCDETVSLSIRLKATTVTNNLN